MSLLLKRTLKKRIARFIINFIVAFLGFCSLYNMTLHSLRLESGLFIQLNLSDKWENLA